MPALLRPILATLTAVQQTARRQVVQTAGLIRGVSSLRGGNFDQITEKDVLDAQTLWADTIVKVGNEYLNGGNYTQLAVDAATQVYGYDRGQVLFKPTKAADVPFRPTPVDALSYFVGGKYDEDKGFAIQPWSEVKFKNHDIYIYGLVAMAMGEYWFTDAKTSQVTKVEYTFGYRKYEDGQVRIFLHHSSVPFKA